MMSRTLEFVAATYSPTWWGSTIGDGELNFSVRNGKRWILTAITATIYVLRKDNQVRNERYSRHRCRVHFVFLAYFLTLLRCSVTIAVSSSTKLKQRKMSGY